jgi:hypothetical protein
MPVRSMHNIFPALIAAQERGRKRAAPVIERCVSVSFASVHVYTNCIFMCA